MANNKKAATPAKTTTKVAEKSAVKNATSAKSTVVEHPLNTMYSVTKKCWVEVSDTQVGTVSKTPRGGYMFQGFDPKGGKIAGIVNAAKAEFLIENGYATEA